MLRIGLRAWLSNASEIPGPGLERWTVFKRGLADFSWVAGHNCIFEERWANEDPTRLRVLAGELACL
jgi:hypothetical protein